MGEALVDLVVSLDGSIRPYLGGGPYNTARTLGRLDVPVAFLGRVSDDGFGGQIMERLNADGVSTELVVTTSEPTTLALATLDASGAATYRFYTHGTSVPGLTPEVAAAQLPVPIHALHVGTLALVLEPLASAVEAVVAAADVDTLVFVDPNIRSRVITDRSSYLARLGRVLARADVVKVSDDDLRWMSPDATQEDAARALLGDGAAKPGPSTVLLTLGADGVAVMTRSAVVHVPAVRVEVADTIGAGDSFAGGVLAWWDDHDRPVFTAPGVAVAATEFGCRVAAATVSVAGANPPSRAQLR